MVANSRIRYVIVFVLYLGDKNNLSFVPGSNLVVRAAAYPHQIPESDYWKGRVMLTYGNKIISNSSIWYS